MPRRRSSSLGSKRSLFGRSPERPAGERATTPVSSVSGVSSVSIAVTPAPPAVFVMPPPDEDASRSFSSALQAIGARPVNEIRAGSPHLKPDSASLRPQPPMIRLEVPQPEIVRAPWSAPDVRRKLSAGSLIPMRTESTNLLMVPRKFSNPVQVPQLDLSSQSAPVRSPHIRRRSLPPPVSSAPASPTHPDQISVRMQQARAAAMSGDAASAADAQSRMMPSVVKIDHATAEARRHGTRHRSQSFIAVAS